MTQFIELVVNWNRGAGWERPPMYTVPGEIGAVEVPMTVGTEAVPDQTPPGSYVTLGSHVVTGEDPAAQAAALGLVLLGHEDTPILLYPPVTPSAESLDQTLTVADAMIGRGLNPRVLYMPEFYWRALGSPDLWTPLNSRRLSLMIEAYTFGAFGSDYYGDDDPRWVGYGGLRSAEIGFLRPTNAPYAAYRGSAEQLAALLAPVPARADAPPTTTPAPAAAPAEPDVPAERAPATVPTLEWARSL